MGGRSTYEPTTTWYPTLTQWPTKHPTHNSNNNNPLIYDNKKTYFFQESLSQTSRPGATIQTYPPTETWYPTRTAFPTKRSSYQSEPKFDHLNDSPSIALKPEEYSNTKNEYYDLEFFKGITLYPTMKKSETPSSKVTLYPTMYPTIKISQLPSSRVTLYPSLSPRTKMTQTLYPTISPTIEKSHNPSKATLYPTMNPTIEKSLNPSKLALYPTMNPSIEKSLSPSKAKFYPTISHISVDHFFKTQVPSETRIVPSVTPPNNTIYQKNSTKVPSHNEASVGLNIAFPTTSPKSLGPDKISTYPPTVTWYPTKTAYPTITPYPDSWYSTETSYPFDDYPKTQVTLAVTNKLRSTAAPSNVMISKPVITHEEENESSVIIVTKEEEEEEIVTPSPTYDQKSIVVENNLPLTVAPSKSITHSPDLEIDEDNEDSGVQWVGGTSDAGKKTSSPTKSPSTISDSPSLIKYSITTAPSSPTSTMNEDFTKNQTFTYSPTILKSSIATSSLSRSCLASVTQEMNDITIKTISDNESLIETKLLFTYRVETNSINNPLKVMTELESSILDVVAASILQCDPSKNFVHSTLRDVFHTDPYKVTSVFLSPTVGVFNVRSCNPTTSFATDCVEIIQCLVFTSTYSSVTTAKVKALRRIQRFVDEQSFGLTPYDIIDGGNIASVKYMGPNPDDVLHSSALSSYNKQYESYANDMSDQNKSYWPKRDIVIIGSFLSLIILSLTLFFFLKYKQKKEKQKKEKRERKSQMFKMFNLE